MNTKIMKKLQFQTLINLFFKNLYFIENINRDLNEIIIRNKIVDNIVHEL